MIKRELMSLLADPSIPDDAPIYASILDGDLVEDAENATFDVESLRTEVAHDEDETVYVRLWLQEWSEMATPEAQP